VTLITLGYGDLFPENNPEYLYTMLLIIVSISVFSIITKKFEGLFQISKADVVKQSLENFETWLYKLDVNSKKSKRIDN
jgi:hypothetical protein